MTYTIGIYKPEGVDFYGRTVDAYVFTVLERHADGRAYRTHSTQPWV